MDLFSIYWILDCFVNKSMNTTKKNH